MLRTELFGNAANADSIRRRIPQSGRLSVLANLRRFLDQRGTRDANPSHWDNSALLGRRAQPVFDAFQEPQVHLQRQLL
jgi:hypothetical protein